MDVPCVVNGSIVEALRSHPPLPSLTCPLRKDVLVRYRLGRGIPSLSLPSFVVIFYYEHWQWNLTHAAGLRYFCSDKLKSVF